MVRPLIWEKAKQSRREPDAPANRQQDIGVTSAFLLNAANSDVSVTTRRSGIETPGLPAAASPHHHRPTDAATRSLGLRDELAAAARRDRDSRGDSRHEQERKRKAKWHRRG